MKSSGQNSFIPGPLIILYTIFIAGIKGEFRFWTGQEKASQEFCRSLGGFKGERGAHFYL